MQILALDVGERRIGIAVADLRGRLASPVGAVLRRDAASTRAAIANVVRERAVTHLLVGVPLGPNGEETPRAASIREFAVGVATALGLPVAFRDERNTTQDAVLRSREATELPEGRRRGARRPPSPQAREAARRRIDAMAAAVLLQAYLDEGPARTPETDAFVLRVRAQPESPVGLPPSSSEAQVLRRGLHSAPLLSEGRGEPAEAGESAEKGGSANTAAFPRHGTEG